MCEAQIQQDVAFLVRQQELFRIVREDTDTIDALIDHAI